MTSIRLGLVILVASSACNYFAPFDPNDQPNRPGALLEDGDRDGDVDVEIEGTCQPNCDRRACGPDECGGLCGSGCAADEVCVSFGRSGLADRAAGYRCQAAERGRWIFIEAGVTFPVGSPAAEFGRDDDEERHDVTLNHDFVIYSSEFT